MINKDDTKIGRRAMMISDGYHIAMRSLRRSASGFVKWAWQAPVVPFFGRMVMSVIDRIAKKTDYLEYKSFM